MSKLDEVIDSLTNENVEEVKEQLISEATALNENNSQLYTRAKKAEGFEKKDGKWVKKEVKEVKPKTEIKAETPGEFDYGEKTFISNLLGAKINDPDQVALVRDYLASGKKLDDLVDNKHFKNDLKDIQDNKAAKEAIPDGSRGSGGTSAKDSVEYYLSKGEMPPEDKPALRRQYVNEKYNREKDVSHFAK